MMATSKRRKIDSKLLPDGGKALEGFLFGNISSTGDKEEEEEEEEESSYSDNDSVENFVQESYKSKDTIKTLEPTSNEINDEISTEESDEELNEDDTNKKPVWHDSDDENDYVDIAEIPKFRKLKQFGKQTDETLLTAAEFQKRLRRYKESKVKSSFWTTHLRDRYSNQDKKQQHDQSITYDSDEMSEDEKTTTISKQKPQSYTKFVATSLPIINSKNGALKQNQLHYIQCRDGNEQDLSQCPIKCCQFLTSSSLYTGGRDKTLRIYDGIGTNAPQKSSSIHFKHLPIKSSAKIETASGNLNVIGLCGRKTFFQFDLETCQTVMFQSFASIRNYPTLHKLAVAPFSRTWFSMLADNGHVLLCDMRMKSIAYNFKMNAMGRCIDLCSQQDMHDSTENTCQNTRLFTGDNDGKIYEWDLTAGKCFCTFQDQGSYGVTAMAISPTSQHLAVGSTNGFVNIYDIRRSTSESYNNGSQYKSTCFFDDDQDEKNFYNKELLAASLLPEESEFIDYTKIKKPFQPIKSLGNLTTTITSIKFHPSNELLAIGSSFSREGVKLIHLPTYTTFRNFPRQDSSLNLLYPTTIDFNDTGSLMVIGNSHGAVKTFLLPYFNNSKRGGKRKKNK